MTIRIGSLSGPRNILPGPLSRATDRLLADPIDVLLSSPSSTAATGAGWSERLRTHAIGYAMLVLGSLVAPALTSTVMAAEAPPAPTQQLLPQAVAAPLVDTEVYGYLGSHSPAAQPYRPVFQKGDYVAHHINFSNLLSDDRFQDWQSMSQKDIQAYLEANHSGLSTYHEGGRLASQIVADAATQNHINPMVVLATLEKESQLVSSPHAGPPHLLRSAMGFAYPDGDQGHHKQDSFTEQIEGGTQLLRQLFDEGTCQKLPGRMAVDFGHRRIQVDNAATWALLRYTPHTVDTHLHEVGGGNYLFHYTFSRAERQVSMLSVNPSL